MSLWSRWVFDTSTLVGAALRPQSTPRQALLHALANGEMVASAATLPELETVLQRSKLDRFAAASDRMAFFHLFQKHARLWSVTAADETRTQGVCRDPKDDKFLALALACEANALVSSDDDLLVLHPWNGLAILSAAQFMQANP